MTTFDHIRQGVAILLLSFALTVATMVVMDSGKRGDSPDQTTIEVTQEKINEKVEKLKELAQREAKLVALDKRTPEQEKELEKLRADRLTVIRELEELEKRKAR